jgi:Flp pilus assembly protein TadG
MKRLHRKNAEHGATMVEFALICFLIMICIMASMEFNRLVLVYTAISNATRAGVRYAIVHGGYRTGTGDPASSAVDKTHVITVVKNFASSGMLNTQNLNVTVSYPASTSPSDPGNKSGSLVVVTVTYRYDPFTVLPLAVNLRSTSRGVIVF